MRSGSVLLPVNRDGTSQSISAVQMRTLKDADSEVVSELHNEVKLVFV